MSHNWGPHFIVPSDTLRDFSGRILLRETLDEELLKYNLESLGIEGSVARISNPWYIRKVGQNTWLKVGESDDKAANFPVSWDTTTVENGKYEVLGLMHVFVRVGDQERIVARQSIVEVTIKN
ncbi:MAG: hypothetical protein JW846_00965 [Dehalococcoidia bacterium]|nr:hypothetical protein [Dehalococcoidia bacterium]